MTAAGCFAASGVHGEALHELIRIVKPGKIIPMGDGSVGMMRVSMLSTLGKLSKRQIDDIFSYFPVSCVLFSMETVCKECQILLLFFSFVFVVDVFFLLFYF